MPIGTVKVEFNLDATAFCKAIDEFLMILYILDGCPYGVWSEGFERLKHKKR